MTRPVDADRATAMPAPYTRMYRYRCFACGRQEVNSHDRADLASPCHPDSVLMPWSERIERGYEELIKRDRAGQPDLATFIEQFEPELYIRVPYFLESWSAARMPSIEDMAVALACAERWGTLTGPVPDTAQGTVDNPLAGWLDGDHYGFTRGRSR